MRHLVFGLAVLALAGCTSPPGSDAKGAELLVFAAASLRDATVELADEFERRQVDAELEVTFNFAGSNTLAQQIHAAPRADVFLSADAHWVDFLEQAGRTIAGSARDVLLNRLVLIAHQDYAGDVDGPSRLAGSSYRHLALADPDAVPAGRYARAHLERWKVAGGDLWARVRERIVPTLDVRAALALVEADPEILGIVYATDTRRVPRVRVLYEFPPLEDLPIRYRAVRIAGGPNPDSAQRFLDFLQGPVARAIVVRHGFAVPGA